MLIVSLLEWRTGWSGDGFEYGLMVESFYNHFSPEARLCDLESFEKNHPGHYTEWIAHMKSSFLENQQHMSSYAGYYTDLKGNKYSYHFWFYSLLNLPSKALVAMLGIKHALLFGITNAIIAFLGLLYLYKNKHFDIQTNILLGVLYIFSPAIFYLKWPHPDFMIATLTYFSFILYYEKRYYWSIFLAALASMHTPPLILLAAFVSIDTLKVKGLNLRNIFTIFLCSCCALLPPLFYFINFGQPNLIVSAGFLDPSFLNLNRLFSFYFDLNQGVIVGILPFLPIFIVLAIVKLIDFKNLKYDITIIVVLLGMNMLSMTMSNWNHGQAVINRYAVWMSMLIVVFVVINMDYKKNVLLIIMATLLQVINISVHEGFYAVPIKYLEHKSFPKWILSNYPSFYNPEPDIFGERTLHYEGVGAGSSPVIFYNKEGGAKKIMVHQSTIDSIDHTLLSKQDLIKGKPIYDWIYIDK